MTREQRQKNYYRQQSHWIRDSFTYIKDSRCIEESFTPDEYLDYLDRKLYRQSNHA